MSTIMHDANWIASLLTGIRGVSDENNALKTGYEPRAREWPVWIEATSITRSQLPNVIPADKLIGAINTEAAKITGLTTDTQVIAGTTDGCASFLATGAALKSMSVSLFVDKF